MPRIVVVRRAADISAIPSPPRLFGSRTLVRVEVESIGSEESSLWQRELTRARQAACGCATGRDYLTAALLATLLLFLLRRWVPPELAGSSTTVVPLVVVGLVALAGKLVGIVRADRELRENRGRLEARLRAVEACVGVAHGG